MNCLLNILIIALLAVEYNRTNRFFIKILGRLVEPVAIPQFSKSQLYNSGLGKALINLSTQKGFGRSFGFL